MQKIGDNCSLYCFSLEISAAAAAAAAAAERHVKHSRPVTSFGVYNKLEIKATCCMYMQLRMVQGLVP